MRPLEGNILPTDSEKMKVSKRTFNVICLIAITFCIFTTIGFSFLIEEEEWIGLLVTFCLGFVFLIIYTTVMISKEIYNKHECLFKRMAIILITLWLFYESNIVGGFYFKSLETSFMIYIIIVPALLDAMFISIGLVTGTLIIIYHAILYIYGIDIPIRAMKFVGITPLATSDEIWLFLLLYWSIYGAVSFFIRTNKKYQKIIEGQNNKNKYELEIAKEVIQYSNVKIPDDFGDNYNFRVMQEPYYEISGDIYIITKIEKYFYIVLMDVCGHGLEAAMFNILLKNELYKLNHTRIDITASNFTASVNGFLESLDKSTTITIIKVNPETGNIEYINNGNYLFIYDGGDCKVLQNSAYGLMDEYNIKKNNIKDKTLIIMTDGIIEGTNVNGVELGEARVVDIIKKGGNIKNNVVAAYNNYINNKQDDITIITIEDKT